MSSSGADWRDGAALLDAEGEGGGGLVAKGDVWLPSFLPMPTRKILPWDRQ